MATATITYAKTAPPAAPAKPAERLRRIGQELVQVAHEMGDAGLTGASVTLVLDDSAGTLTVSGGPFAASRVIQVA